VDSFPETVMHRVDEAGLALDVPDYAAGFSHAESHSVMVGSPTPPPPMG